MNTPKVTVCIPTYNYAHYLGAVIASVLDQTFEEFELLIADDASSDDTEQVVARFLDDPRVRFMPNQQNNGMFANFNRCITEARGEYIKFLMADDWLASRFLEETVALLEAQPELEFCSVGAWQIDEAGAVFAEEIQSLGDGPIAKRADVVALSAAGTNAIGMPTCTLIRTSALRAVGGFDADFAPAADLNLWMKLLARGDLGWIPRPLCFLRIHDSHTHQWGNDPHRSALDVWRAAPQIAGSAASEQTAADALASWSVKFSVSAIKHLLGGDVAGSRTKLAEVREYVGLRTAVVSLIRALPQMLRDRRVTSRARRAGEAIRYTPHPQRGDALETVRATADAALGDRLRTESGARTSP